MVFDYSGSYDSAFLGLAVLMALGLILVLTLPKTKAAAA
jgi:MFS-type transporter involved in bile tolerance (Atg22 family)